MDNRSMHDSDSEHDSAEFDNYVPDDPNTIITVAPEQRFRLGYLSVMGLIVNRMIGSGIFNTPSTAMQGTRSIGITLLFWLCGVIYTLAGTHLFIEYGLTTPRHKIDGVEQGVPRSGGTLNYLQYVFTRPAYRKHTVMFSTCVFGIAYIVLGNMAGNCMNFAVRVFEAAGVSPENGPVRGVAIAAATLSCFVHAISRRGGIWLSNILALIKVAMLLFIIVTGIMAYAGTFDSESFASENLAPKNAFSGAADDSYGYAQAFLSIIFAFNGFEQPNYVLGEIGRPRKKFPWATVMAVSLVCILYVAVNIVYMIVVPEEDQVLAGGNVALQFFERTFGNLSPNDNRAQRILSAFLAISSFGNIIVMTFTAARVKQEIAKEGILPWPKFFGQNRDISFGRFLKWAHKTTLINRPFHGVLRLRFLDPSEHSQETPVGALFLHWVFCIILIIATWGQYPNDAYGVLISLFTYVHTLFGFMLSAGMLYLRVAPNCDWRNKASGFVPFFSILAALLFGLGNLFPVVALWVPPSGTVGALWWLGFLAVAKRIESKKGNIFTVEKRPEFDRDPPESGDFVQVHETVYLAWVAKESMEDKELLEMEHAAPDYARTA
ncbi:hypothetical protein H2199_004408 [Coniosporium tulheliwenetii]|uniref:Uncharacterized protein n=1 Tax=Coniosporium tulheliwenetii TaxID=3383036 RepID=A0ACC2Z5T5_9PEZI|nr:hypothetical protein H2199_004408 [Cladosporium sp. JES 115]